MTDITTNSTQVINNPEFGKLRVIEKNGKPWFVGKDVTEILGYKNSRNALRKHVSDADKGTANCDTLGGKQKMIVINESGLYSLVLSSKMPIAKRFRHWVANEVLPEMHQSVWNEPTPSESSGIQIFENPEFGKVRVVEMAGEPWFVGKDVAEILGYSKARNAIAAHVDNLDKALAPIQGGCSTGTQNTTIINESGIYSLVLSSKLPSAQKFKHWVTSEVIPSIRKHGGYIAGQNEMSDMELLSRALLLVKNQLDDRNRQIEEMQPKVIFADAVETSSTSVLIGDFAKLLKQNGIDIGQTRLFEWLRNNGYLMRVKGERRNMPTQRSMEMKLFEIKESVIEHKDGHLTIIRTPKVTGKGQIYFASKFLQDRFLQE